MWKEIEIANRDGFKGEQVKPIKYIGVGEAYFPYGFVHLNVDDKRANWLSREEATQLYDTLGELLGKEAKPDDFDEIFAKSLKATHSTTFYTIGGGAKRYVSVKAAGIDAEECARLSDDGDSFVVYEVTERPLRRYRMVAAEPTLVVEDLE